MRISPAYYLLAIALTGCASASPKAAPSAPAPIYRLRGQIQAQGGAAVNPIYRLMDFIQTQPGIAFLWINEQEEMRGIVSEQRSDDGGITWQPFTSTNPIKVFWTANVGSFTDPNSPITTYCASSWSEPTTSPILWSLNATQPGGPAKDDPQPTIALAASTTQPTGQVDVDTTSSPDDSKPFKDELTAAAAELDRDSVIADFQRAMILRPNDPLNIVLEFKIGLMLGQNPDPNHNQPIHPDQALAIFQHIVKAYDHQVYYKKDFPGVGNSPDFMVPRAAVLVASYLNASGDAAAARDYLLVALNDMQWTCKKRQADWEAPLPVPTTSPFNDSLSDWGRDPKQEAAFRQREWEQKKYKAQIADVFGDSEIHYAKAAVRQFGIAYAILNPTNPGDAMSEIIRLYPNTPMEHIAWEDMQSEVPPR